MKNFEYEFPRPSIATDIVLFTLENGSLSIVLVKERKGLWGWLYLAVFFGLTKTSWPVQEVLKINIPP